MGFFWRHKLLSLFLAAAIFYWFKNPAGRFGYVQKDFVVYNRVPVTGFDLYINVKGGMFLESDLKNQNNIKYWYDNHSPCHVAETPSSPVTLYVGTGFEKNTLKLSDTICANLRKINYKTRHVPSLEAIKLYNADRDSGRQSAILIYLRS